MTRCFNNRARINNLLLLNEDFKLEKGPTDKAKEPDPGGSDQQNLGFKKLKNRKTDRTVGLNCCISKNTTVKNTNTTVQSNRTISFSVFQFFATFT